jgi:hypothetical protein
MASPWLGQRRVLRGINDENRMVLAVLVALFLASLGAELAGVEKIVGAFLAGLAVNSVLPEGRVKEQVIFVGGVLFIPIFFIDLGLLLDVGSLGASISNFRFTALMLMGAIGGKGLASWISGRAVRLPPAADFDDVVAHDAPGGGDAGHGVHWFPGRLAEPDGAQCRAGGDGGHGDLGADPHGTHGDPPEVGFIRSGAHELRRGGCCSRWR